ncbi:hypothetical protein DAPPUDRAFT_260944 [Daphnia pulex]|uniref:Uncharacterized protein n=1 Tax=Daphnia pulex TaxID=6669 RepID=E9HK61_DAPPU|nr:hypothetical protein DAPPUDRAFT_260944 [Daphnia pulex]|eukprot:EFX67888.1 hypothetical protein DAPPUDRAFT_260944 [Daphnia pulex]
MFLPLALSFWAFGWKSIVPDQRHRALFIIGIAASQKFVCSLRFPAPGSATAIR